MILIRIAFVGKGGSGKTTLSSIFSLYLSSLNKNVLMIDADINMHSSLMLGISPDICISSPDNMTDIKRHLIGRNQKTNMSNFLKSTPPSTLSNLVSINESDYIISKYSKKVQNIWHLTVGTYNEEDISRSCYHGNLTVFENLLSHLDDKDGYVVSDMVAGVDAFANTLYAQFDMIIISVEPNIRSVEVYEHYMRLSKEAGIDNLLFVAASKVNNQKELEFIKSKVDNNKIIGVMHQSNYLRECDMSGEAINYDKLETENKELFQNILYKLDSLYDPNLRKQRLKFIHKKLIEMPHIKKNYGDLSFQLESN